MKRSQQQIEEGGRNRDRSRTAEAKSKTIARKKARATKRETYR